MYLTETMRPAKLKIVPVRPLRETADPGSELPGAVGMLAAGKTPAQNCDLLRMILPLSGLKGRNVEFHFEAHVVMLFDKAGGWAPCPHFVLPAVQRWLRRL